MPRHGQYATRWLMIAIVKSCIVLFFQGQNVGENLLLDIIQRLFSHSPPTFESEFRKISNGEV